jgi:hypothetical protein
MSPTPVAVAALATGSLYWCDNLSMPEAAQRRRPPSLRRPGRPGARLMAHAGLAISVCLPAT